VGRFLVVVPPLEGHTNPTVSLGEALARRGHEVAWTGHPEVVPALLPAGATFIPVADRAPDAVVEATAARNLAPVGGAVGFRALWEEFVLPIAHQMVPGTRAAVDRFRPDVLVVDQHAVAGAAVALERELPWATSATSSADLVDPLAGLPKVQQWLRDQMCGVLTDAGVAPAAAAGVDPRFSPHLVVAFTSAALVGDNAGFPDHWALVGPALGGRADTTPFPWEWLDSDDADDPDMPAPPVVLVSLGTVNWRAGGRFFAAAAEALGTMDVRAVIVAPPDLVPDPPPNVLALPRVPQVALLDHVELVVSHGGHNTVCEALAKGLPLVLAPVRDDQPFVADQVVQAGAGERVKFGRVTAPVLRQVITAVLTEPGYRAAAARLRASFAAAGGADAAADELEALLRAAPVGAPPRTSPGS
jgi:MGT family glycosyltransferase